MAKEKPPEPPGEDIPAWFMTYSDVITLLMTFFILLLTFSTTEPDRFERISKTVFSGGTGTGVVGQPIEGPELEAFIQRVRPRSARMALAGSEMPSYLKEPSKNLVGEGLKGLSDEESKQDVMTTNQFEIKIDSLMTPDLQLRPRGAQVASMLARQLDQLPVHMTVECSNPDNFERATAFVTHLYQTEKIRPGQVGVGVIQNLNSDSVRFSVERYDF